MTKHTPRPWKAVHGSETLTIRHGDAFVATLTNIGSVIDRTERDANGSLIEAAPDLLESCRELFALACSPESFGEQERQGVLDRARAARTKAGD